MGLTYLQTCNCTGVHTIHLYDPLIGFERPTSNGREERGQGMRRERREEKGGGCPDTSDLRHFGPRTLRT